MIYDEEKRLSFKEFRSRLAHKCEEFIAAGGFIFDSEFNSDYDECRCPLGAGMTGDHHPDPSDAAAAWCISIEQAEAFASGFDGFPVFAPGTEKFHKLGKTYRGRFVVKGAEL